MFGGGGRQQQSGPKKVKPFKYPMKVTLEEVYNGKKTKIAVNRERYKVADGKNLKDAYKTCPKCKGTGRVTKMQQLGPGMYT